MITIEILEDQSVGIVFDREGGELLVSLITRLVASKGRDHEHLFGHGLEGDELNLIRLSTDQKSTIVREAQLVFWPSPVES